MQLSLYKLVTRQIYNFLLHCPEQWIVMLEDNILHVIPWIVFEITLIKKIKSVAYSSQGSHTGQLDFCNWLADGSTTG